MFNKRLREMRMKRGFTQQKLADTLNIALRSYQCMKQEHVPHAMTYLF